MTLDVAIIGAGLTGLTAAIHLQKKGKKVHLFEKGAKIGGFVTTDEHEGFLLDQGFQVLLNAYPECRQMLDYAPLKLHPFKRGFLLRVQDRWIRLQDPRNAGLKAFGALFSGLFKPKDVYVVSKLYRQLLQCSPEQLLIDGEDDAIDTLHKLGFSDHLIELFFKPLFGGILLDGTLKCSGRLLKFMMKMLFDGDTSLPWRGMRAIPEQLAALIPVDCIHLNSPVEDLKALDAKAILLACNPFNLCRLMGFGDPPPGREVLTFYFESPSSPLGEPILALNGNKEGIVNHLAVLSDINPHYAPHGRHLISVIVICQTEVGERTQARVLEELSNWFGLSVFKWKFLKAYRILNPHPAAYPLRWKLPQGYYHADAYMETPSIEGAMSSARKVVNEICASLTD